MLRMCRSLRSRCPSWATSESRTMSDRPKLSICVPSRNRQDCFQQTILDLVANPRTDIEFVVTDNSDDPSIMDGFIAGLQDGRIRYLPSADRPFSIGDNWERTIAVATGDWVTVIGDDDYVDPDVIDRIAQIESHDDAVDAIGWNRVPFEWPSVRTEEKSISFSLKNRIMRHSKDQLERRLFGWAASTYMPLCPYGIYHGAIPRRTLDRIASHFSGRFFEHPTIDYDFMHKLIASASNFAYINRPMSILGVAAASNSAAIGNTERLERAVADHRRVYGDAFYETTRAAGFPFQITCGIAGNIMAAQIWFKERYGFAYDGWQENFTRAATLECSLWRDRDGYDRHVAGIEAAFREWEGGRYLPLFQPRFVGHQAGPTFWGVRDDHLYISQEIAGAETPRAFYDVLQDILPAFEDMEVAL
jgi:glycosyltransferase involved in cell wall biosynthesis